MLQMIEAIHLAAHKVDSFDHLFANRGLALGAEIDAKYENARNAVAPSLLVFG
ncbi:MAG: hypothetical protein LLF96_07305 [Eubacteriales bacterium]|nr:hypothetical protein [Eubacteriales bacterium]